MTEFVGALVEALKSELEPYVDQPVFVDKDRLRPGYRFNEALADALCASACWIVIYVPQYWKREYCLRELQGMLELEEARRRQLGRRMDRRTGMVIPVILRGKREDLPADLDKSTQCLSFNAFTTAEADILRNPKYIKQVAAVASYVHDVYRLGEELTCECRDFVIPSLDGRLGEPPPPQPFPGRSRRPPVGSE